MPKIATATRRTIAVRTPVSTAAIAHLVRSVCQRLIRVGRDIVNRGPTSFGAKPSAPSSQELTIVAPMKPHIISSSET